MRWLMLVGLIGFVFSSPEHAAGQSRADTIPEHVVDRGSVAFNHHNLRALADLYAADARLSYLTADSSSRSVAAGPDSMFAAMSKYVASQKKPPHLKVVERASAGAFVADIYDFTDDAGTRRVIDIYEVRNGKIVHEWQQPDPAALH